MADSAQEKTEQPTPKRRKEAREKGQVVKSVELNSVVILINEMDKDHDQATDDLLDKLSNAPSVLHNKDNRNR